MSSVLRLSNTYSGRLYGHSPTYENDAQGLAEAKIAFDDIVQSELSESDAKRSPVTMDDLIGCIRIKRCAVGKEDDDFVYTIEDYEADHDTDGDERGEESDEDEDTSKN